MLRKLLLLLILGMVLASALPSMGDEQKNSESETKELSGMSIVGNDEAPKSLYIVPWKSSEIGAEAGLKMMLNDKDTPVDPEVFLRQLEFYRISTSH